MSDATARLNAEPAPPPTTADLQGFPTVEEINKAEASRPSPVPTSVLTDPEATRADVLRQYPGKEIEAAHKNPEQQKEFELQADNLYLELEPEAAEQARKFILSRTPASLQVIMAAKLARDYPAGNSITRRDGYNAATGEPAGQPTYATPPLQPGQPGYVAPVPAAPGTPGL